MDWKIVYEQYRYAYSLTKNKMDAEDLLQEVCVKMIEKDIVNYNPSFIKKVIKNLFVDRYGYDKVRKKINVDNESEELYFIEEETGHENPNQSDIIFMALDKINEVSWGRDSKLADIIIMNVFLNIKCREIASIMNMKLNTVIGRLRYGREKLKPILTKELQYCR